MFSINALSGRDITHVNGPMTSGLFFKIIIIPAYLLSRSVHTQINHVKRQAWTRNNSRPHLPRPKIYPKLTESSNFPDVKTSDFAPSRLVLCVRYQKDDHPMSRHLGPFNASPGPQSPLGSPNAASFYTNSSDVSIRNAQKSIVKPL